MSTQAYLQQKNRNKVRRELKKTKPYLQGIQLENEIDRILGVIDTGKLDWMKVVNEVKPTELSAYSLPESIGYEEIKQVAHEYNVRPYLLYWFYHQKIEQLKSSGRTKYNYLSTLKNVATKIVSRDLDETEKITAAILYAKQIGAKPLTKSQAKMMLLMGEL